MNFPLLLENFQQFIYTEFFHLRFFLYTLFDLMKFLTLLSLKQMHFLTFFLIEIPNVCYTITCESILGDWIYRYVNF